MCANAHPQSHPHPQRRHLGRWLLAGLGGAGLAGSYAAWAALRSAPPPPEAPQDLCLVAPLQAWTPALGADPWAARMPTAASRCPVCGMFPARQPHWASQLIYRDGDAHYFDTALCLLRYLQQPGRHARGRSAKDIARIYLADYMSASPGRQAAEPESRPTPPRWLHAEQAWLLADSHLQGRAAGPMRHAALPALPSREAAQALQAHLGGRLLPWAELQALPPPQWPASLRMQEHAHAHPDGKSLQP